jgi:hypothetical protein
MPNTKRAYDWENILSRFSCFREKYDVPIHTHAQFVLSKHKTMAESSQFPQLECSCAALKRRSHLCWLIFWSVSMEEDVLVQPFVFLHDLARFARKVFSAYASCWMGPTRRHVGWSLPVHVCHLWRRMLISQGGREHAELDFSKSAGHSIWRSRYSRGRWRWAAVLASSTWIKKCAPPEKIEGRTFESSPYR